MLGCIGVAAPGDFAPTSAPAGNYGGNLDYNEIGEGATVILPVFHPGGLLFLGDGHALMADGEPTGTGVETSMDVEFSVEVRKNAQVNGPRVETDDYLISVGAQPEFASSLDRALQMATTDMVRWLVSDYKLEPWAAHQLIGAVGKYDVVTVAGTMALKVPKKYLGDRPVHTARRRAAADSGVMSRCGAKHLVTHHELPHGRRAQQRRIEMRVKMPLGVRLAVRRALVEAHGIGEGDVRRGCRNGVAALSGCRPAPSRSPSLKLVNAEPMWRFASTMVSNGRTAQNGTTARRCRSRTPCARRPALRGAIVAEQARAVVRASRACACPIPSRPRWAAAVAQIWQWGCGLLAPIISPRFRKSGRSRSPERTEAGVLLHPGIHDRDVGHFMRARVRLCLRRKAHHAAGAGLGFGDQQAVAIEAPPGYRAGAPQNRCRRRKSRCNRDFARHRRAALPGQR